MAIFVYYEVICGVEPTVHIYPSDHSQNSELSVADSDSLVQYTKAM